MAPKKCSICNRPLTSKNTMHLTMRGKSGKQEVHDFCCFQCVRWFVSPKESESSYKSYIKSDKWRAKSSKAKRKAKRRCQLCGATDVVLDTHHNTYKNLGHEKPEDLIVLCQSCHTKFHEQKNCDVSLYLPAWNIK